MREILFRGKRIDNCKWAYGSLTTHRLKNYVFIEVRTDKGHSLHMVDDETVGQYTGLTDKNGTKIFEGDILQYINEYSKTHCITVVFEECAFLIEDNGVTDCDLLPSYNCLGLEVIGNIHENPELLSGEKNA